MSAWNLAIVSLSLVVLAFYAYFKLVASKYFAKRNVPHLPPKFFIGNFWEANLTKSFSTLLTELHLANKDKKAVGFWVYTKPQILVTDLELAKRILIRDFSQFRDRGMEVDEERDPLAAHLFLLSGKKWRNLRVKMTPAFTSGKMKFMFPTMRSCGEELQKHLKGIAENKETVEIKDLLARFTTDIISSVAFGLETNSLQNPNSEFRKFGKKVFQVDLRFLFVNILFLTCPKLLKLFKLRIVPKDVSDFFINAVRETVEYREKNSITRNDFLQMMIQLIRAGKVEDADRNIIDAQDMDDETLIQKFSLNQAAAQCFVFFAAGFETSSTAMTFALYELALNPNIQAKLQSEIDEKLEKVGFTYEAVCSMEYLDMVVQETLRKYPPVPNLQRVSNTEYYIPEINATIDKGTLMIISVVGFHRDPTFYPDPDRFNPERFSPEEKNKRDGITFLPFGEGPRNCIGNRFGLMQVKTGLISILSRFNVEMAKTTPVPLKYEVRSFILAPEGGMPLTFSKRK